jgi:hypothetical protein
MKHHGAGASPRLRARAAGFFNLMAILTGVFAQAAVRDTLVVSGDAAATAHNILASESLYRMGFAADLIGVASYVAVTLLLFELLAPVSWNVSLLAAFFSLVGCATLAVDSLAHLAALLLLNGPHYLAAFGASQLQAMALFSLRLHTEGYIVGEVFFGIYCILLGWLIFRSTFLPRAIGVLMAIEGFCNLVNSFAHFLSPPFAELISGYALLPGLLGEGSLTLWLLAVGLNVAKWNESNAKTV